MKEKSSKIFWSLLMFLMILLYAVLNMMVDWSNYLFVNLILFIILKIYFQYNLYVTIVLLIFVHGIYLIVFFITSIFYFSRIHLSTTFIMKRSLFQKDSYKINASIHPITFLCVKKHEKQFGSKISKYNKLKNKTLFLTKNQFFSQIMTKDFNLAIQKVIKIIEKDKNVTTITFKTHEVYIDKIQRLIKKFTNANQYDVSIKQRKWDRLYIEPFAYLSLWQSIVYVLKHPESLWRRRPVYEVKIKKIL
ncbi:hypothetical protein O163_04765 [Caldanaerobacter subterraneus subsp. yonseiensis KB-1]|uniref:Uncharacterized protein n=1 Tax=Caldanaerobacter subterraneus subsp. yonseiensis KB-1 TaxID=1388761 RepID=U5CHS5_CALSX|nr:hypothetical protein [Caldanaerobacter subterraneus]ERM92480.1 hypothetical protein O163_04765 [Caldanaerobacter subterraneus subsp. yonseiensis KB-1]